MKQEGRNKEKTTKTTVVVLNDSRPQTVEASPDFLEKAVPTNFPIVGIGASAGGLAAFEAFFSGSSSLDKDLGMAYILVQHLAPDRKSILCEIIRRYTRMQVFEVEDGMKVEPNCIYIIPPGRDMAYINGALQLMEPFAPRGFRLPIDFFFRSLAQDLHERAIGIILSGTGSDGSMGVRSIKDEGGMVMVQTPKTAEYDGMPLSAIATGLVDFELPPAEMLKQLIAYASYAFRDSLKSVIPPLPQNGNSFKKIFILLRDQMGHDFSQYKLSTIQRRIERRMAVHQIETMEEYVKFIQKTPLETEALFRDMLIGVTNFFRDPTAFSALEEQVIPRILARGHTGSTIRVWVPGCSTGEEAYSLAILLKERIAKEKRSFKLQIFATDIDSRAVAVARLGIYPASIRECLTQERLDSFFIPEPSKPNEIPAAYRIQKDIRDLMVFSEQDVIKDPPFSKLDLISCRNLMIYLDGDLQNKLIPLFHYALNPDGFLFLGTSETVGSNTDFFAVIDHKSKIYQRKADFNGMQRLAIGQLMAPFAGRIEKRSNRTSIQTTTPVKLSLRELTETALLKEIFSAGILVNKEGDILYLHGRTGLYLEPTPGEVGVNNILKMAREGLGQNLTIALHQAVGSKETVRYSGLRVKTNGDFSTVNLTVCPVYPSMPSQIVDTIHDVATETLLFLVILQNTFEKPKGVGSRTKVVGKRSKGFVEADTPEVDVERPDNLSIDARIAALTFELHTKDDYLVTSNEELKSLNEEMQSVNEELQSTNEELETSKEELQSINEELATVNSELQIKLADLSRANNDMNNLLAGTGIATIFIDHQLRILRFTPTATRIINLIPTDVGRSVGHIVSNLKGHDQLAEDVQSVLDTLIPKEEQLQTKNGKWYTMHIMPYRTLDNIIEGAVITFVDITLLKQAEDERLAFEQKCRIFQELSQEAHLVFEITENGRDLGIVDCNKAALDLLKMTREQLLSANLVSLSPERQSDGSLSQEKAKELIIQCLSTKMLRFDWLCSSASCENVSVEITLTLYMEHGKTFLYSVWRDLTRFTLSTPDERPKERVEDKVTR